MKDKITEKDKELAIAYYGEPEKKIKEGLYDIITRYKRPTNRGGYSADELVDMASVMFFSFARKCLNEVQEYQELDKKAWKFINDEIEKETKSCAMEIKKHRCREKTGNWCLDCEILNSKAMGILWLRDLIQKNDSRKD